MLGVVTQYAGRDHRARREGRRAPGGVPRLPQQQRDGLGVHPLQVAGVREPRLHARRSRRCCCARTSTSGCAAARRARRPDARGGRDRRSSSRRTVSSGRVDEDFAILLDLQAPRSGLELEAGGRRRSTTASAPRRGELTRDRAPAAGARPHGRRLRAAGRLRPAARLPARPGQGSRCEASECGAFLLFDFYNIRYTTQTWIGGALGDKMIRYALLTRGRDPVLWDFGSAVKHHQLYSPVGADRELPGRLPRLPRRRRADGRADGRRGRARSRRCSIEAGVADLPVGVDIVEPPFLFEMQRQGLHGRRRPAAHARRAGDQVAPTRSCCSTRRRRWSTASTRTSSRC